MPGSWRNAGAGLGAVAPQLLQALSQLFDDVAEDEFQRLPAKAECAARRRLGDALAEFRSPPIWTGCSPC